MGMESADAQIWTALREQVDREDPVPASVIADAYACLDRARSHASAEGIEPDDPSLPKGPGRRSRRAPGQMPDDRVQ
jgi:hypothetical protein